MNLLNYYRELLNQQGKLVQLIELYNNAGLRRIADKYVFAKWEIDKKLVQLRKELLVTNK